MADVRLLLADDHTLVRHGLRKILEERPDLQVVGEASTGREAVNLAAELKPDVVILDIGMPLLNGIDATRQIVRRLPGVKVLILSMHAEEEYIARAMAAGACGYLLKDSAGDDLVRAVDAARAGKSFFSPSVAQVMLDDYVRRVSGTESVDRYETLSEREREIFQLIAEAKSNRDIADILAISVATVETHRARILQKLDVHNMAELVLYAVRRGVIS